MSGGHTATNNTAVEYETSTKKSLHRAYIAVGSNLGDRYLNIRTALDHLNSNSDNDDVVEVVQTSYLHETPPMYVTDQPPFLNGVVEIRTTLPPDALLDQLKLVERRAGRDVTAAGSQRYGPRPVDLDILLYGDDVVLDTDRLTIPHPRMGEREFVLLPMCELNEYAVHPVSNSTMAELRDQLDKDDNTAVRVLPLPRGRMLRFTEVVVMGILNVTPDSFSDGGKLQGSVEIATQKALQMVADGAGIIDIGGESTRPGAKEIDINLELGRTIPVIKSIRQVSDVPISIDTRHAQVARAAVDAGADMVNDVSGGSFDPDMLSTVAALGVPVVLMHMRGTPETMQNMTEYADDVVTGVADALTERSVAAQSAGIPRWLQVVDPGIGFAKDLGGNLSLMKHMYRLRTAAGDGQRDDDDDDGSPSTQQLQHMPLLIGPSRKGFIGKITGEVDPEKRDFGSAAACLVSLMGSSGSMGQKSNNCSIVRVHNVHGIKQALMIMEAIREAQ